jgi:sugar/nucleoside kinase (ribokinase family)
MPSTHHAIDLSHRAVLARSAAESLARANLASRHALVGFDGFVDLITDLVDTRADMAPLAYTRISTLTALAARVGAAAGKSTNIEAVTHEKRWGGNGPLLAGGLARLGISTTYIGAVGREDDPRTLDPVFAPFASLCERVVPIAAPGRTDALEFDDGKLMINHCGPVQAVTWERIVEVVGLQTLRELVARADVLGIVNWSLLGGVGGIWRGLVRDIFPSIARAPRIFIDLSDPAKRTDADLLGAMDLLRELNARAPVTLGLNLAEAERLARVWRVDATGAPTDSRRTLRLATDLRGALGLDCVVVHPREGAAAAEASGERAWFDGPMTRAPRLSTGAGDHFNAGFAGAQIAGLPIEQCLASGVALSGAYVRDGGAPTLSRLLDFLADLPAPE